MLSDRIAHNALQDRFTQRFPQQLTAKNNTKKSDECDLCEGLEECMKV